MKLYGERVREGRERLALSMEDASVKARVSPHTWVRAEHGDEIRPSSARRIASALGVEPGQLLGEAVLLGKVEAPEEAGPSEEEADEEQRGASELSANDLSDLCGELYAKLQSVRETPAEDLKTQAIADLDADLKEAQAALSATIYRKGPPRLSELSIQLVMRQRRQRAQQSDEDAASESG